MFIPLNIFLLDIFIMVVVMGMIEVISQRKYPR